MGGEREESERGSKETAGGGEEGEGGEGEVGQGGEDGEDQETSEPGTQGGQGGQSSGGEGERERERERESGRRREGGASEYIVCAGDYCMSCFLLPILQLFLGMS